ncbi:MAG: radical SAM protein [Bacteroidota bacterium]|nr:radical SAM protein [Bacteroidota bacterium]MDP4215979.1 radical SAM protein [Bacteroidota bacterium]MDP4245098.1 radical SAM protein [Bacteroidota bacterium]MDP4252532.1 radical SAM protein [Bacteroidota bacterium]MDP4257832.1 radical SAM protein [Bacteroidota bacterium]
MKKILFSHSYFMRLDPKQWETGQPYPPLGTLHAAAFMRANGFPVALFDTQFAEGPDKLIDWLDAERPDVFVIYDDGFNYLTKMCLTNMREAAFRMIRLAKERGCTVILSGSDSTDHYQKYLEHGADFVLLGEGEMTLLELITAIRYGVLDFSQIPGLALRQHNDPIKTTGRKLIKDLDALPMPAWDLVDMSMYRNTWLSHAGYFSLNVGTTRGCPFKCNWCAKPIYGNRYHARSPRHVVEELKWLKEQYAFDHIWFCDDIFGLKPGWVDEFADLVEEAGLKFRFKIQSRADLLVQQNYVRALARAGCADVWMGAESGSQKILDAMDKGITVEQIRVATQLLRQHGVKASFFIQFGYPGETREDIQKTIRMINTLLPDSLGISVSYPLPGTVFYERVKADLKEKANWTDSDELQIMFRNAHTPAFYKQLHRYVHKTYRRHLALASLKNLFAHPAATSWASLKRAASLAWYTPSALLAGYRLHRIAKIPHS